MSSQTRRSRWWRRTSRGGEAGEFTRSPRTQGWLVTRGRLSLLWEATPYLPVIELLKTYRRIQEPDDPRTIRERVAGKLLMLDRALEPLLTPLLALLDVTVDEATWDALDGNVVLRQNSVRQRSSRSIGLHPTIISTR